MSIRRKLLTMGIAAYVLSANVGQGANQGIALSITAVEPTVSFRAEVKLRATLINNTSHAVTFFDSDPVCDYIADVRDGKGDPLPMKDSKRLLSCQAKLSDARNILITLQPKESRDDEILLSALCKLSHPGKYSVRVVRNLPKELGGGVESNILSITVTQ